MGLGWIGVVCVLMKDLDSSTNVCSSASEQHGDGGPDSGEESFMVFRGRNFSEGGSSNECKVPSKDERGDTFKTSSCAEVGLKGGMAK
jgi:hypothetical protein